MHLHRWDYWSSSMENPLVQVRECLSCGDQARRYIRGPGKNWSAKMEPFAFQARLTNTDTND